MPRGGGSHSRKFQDLTGKRFGRWLILSVAQRSPYMRWLCRCDCGTEKTVPPGLLKNGDSKSCGCLKRELDKQPKPYLVKHHCSRYERSRIYREKYRKDGRTSARARAWRARNLQHYRITAVLAMQKRKARIRQAPGNGITREQWSEILEVFGHACAYCLNPGTDMDHLVPLTRGGAHDPENIVPACKSCNSRKHNHSLLKFVSIGGGLV